MSTNRWRFDCAATISAIAFAILLTARLPVQAQDTMQEAKAMAAYPLTMDHVTKVFQAAADFARDPAIKAQFNALSDLGLEERIRHMEMTPRLSGAIRSHGLTPRDFVMTNATFVAAMAVNVQIGLGQKGPGPDADAQMLWAAAPPEHIAFYKDHKAEIDKVRIESRQATMAK